jgi:hypothetical protein
VGGVWPPDWAFQHKVADRGAWCSCHSAGRSLTSFGVCHYLARMNAREIATGCALTALLLATSARAVPITACNQTVPVGEVGVLQGDVVCADGVFNGVFLEKRATLDLNGFTLTGGIDAAYGVFCLERACEIRGPGVIDGGVGRWVGVQLEPRVKLTIRDVTVRNGRGGIAGKSLALEKTRVILEGVRIEDNDEGALGSYYVVANDLVVLRNGQLLFGQGEVVGARSFRGENVEISDNAFAGLGAGTVSVENLIASNNGGVGVSAGRLILRGNSQAFGNDAALDGIDLRSQRPPRLLDSSTCGKSSDFSGMPWGVCQND